MTCTLLAVARASVTESAGEGAGGVRAGCYSDVPNVLELSGGPIQCANLIRTFLFPIIHPNPILYGRELK